MHLQVKLAGEAKEDIFRAAADIEQCRSVQNAEILRGLWRDVARPCSVGGVDGSPSRGFVKPPDDGINFR